MSSNASIANARWADPDYIADRYFYEPEKGDVWIGRNPHNFGSVIGYRDERHIMVCAGAGSGKGRSFIVNNLAMYPGSTITYDPKGELPFILAPRRGDGNHLCDGMGQKVFVLDPLKRSGVDEQYLGYCDPISMLNPKDPELSTWCFRLARSLVKEKKSGQGSDWADKGIAFSALVIEHVVTWRYIKKNNRNMHYVLQLILEGNVESAERINAILQEQADVQNAELGEDEEPIIPRKVDPYEVLLRDMTKNEDANRYLAMEARKLERESKNIPKYFSYVSGEAAEGLRWLRSESMERALKGWGDRTRRFDPHKLKTDNISLFIVLPVDDLDLYEPWLQSLFIGIFAAMREDKTKPKFPVLTFLDEFSSLGYQEYIATSLDNIRGAGMKLCFIVQNLGKLKKLYGDEMESFFTNSGLELYFGKIGQTAIDYLKKELGETQVIMTAHSQNTSQSESESVSNSIAFGETSTHGVSETVTDSVNSSITTSKSFNWSDSVNWSDSTNWGQSEGSSMGTNYGPHVFFQGFQHSNNYGTNLNKNQGGSRSKGHNKTRGGGSSESSTTGRSQSTARGTTSSHSTSRTETETAGKTTGYQIGGGIAESFHKKPLLDAHEINTHLRSIPASECDHPAYPGMMLVRIAGEDPTFARRSNYDQDPYFERCFSEDPLHAFVPLKKQPLLGHEYTPEHVANFGMPALLRKHGFKASALVRAHQKIDMRMPLFSYCDENSQSVDVPCPLPGRVVAVAGERDFTNRGEIVTVKLQSPTTAKDALVFKKAVFGQAVQRLKTMLAKEEKQKAAREAKAKRLAAEKARAEQEARDNAWHEYNCWHESEFGTFGTAWRIVKLIGTPTLIGFWAAPLGLAVLFEIFDSSLESFPMWAAILGLIGGIVKGLVAYNKDKGDLTARFRNRAAEINQTYGYVHG